MVIINSWLLTSGPNPYKATNEELQQVVSSYGWKITNKRREGILGQIDKILQPLKNRVTNFIEKLK